MSGGLLFLNGHGGNTSSLDAAFFEVYTEAPRIMDGGDELRCLAAEWWDATGDR